MAPIDPGPTIHWARNPSYTLELVVALSHLSRDDQVVAFSAPTSLPNADVKRHRLDVVTHLTRQVFDAQGDPHRLRKQRDSVQRRMTSLAKDYRDDISFLKQDPFHVDETLRELQQSIPWWNTLREILKHHPDFPQWDEQLDRAHDDEDDAYRGQRGEGPQQEAPMQEDHYWQGQQKREEPVAGPSNARQRQLDDDRARFERQRLEEMEQLQQQEYLDYIRSVYGDATAERIGGRLGGGGAVASGSRERRRSASPSRRAGFSEQGERGYYDGEDPRRRGRGGSGGGWDPSPDRRSLSPRPVARQLSRNIAAAQEPPRIEPEPPRRQGADDDDDDVLTECPKCQQSLVRLAPVEQESHISLCLDGREAGQAAPGVHLASCPVCDASLDGPGWTDAARERHVDDCCQGLSAGGGGRVHHERPEARNELRTGPGPGAFTNMTERRTKRDHVVFILDDKTIPKDDKTGQPLECSFCLDEFERDVSVCRLSCYCVYHEQCIEAYWQQPGKFCPLHRDLDDISEVEMS